MFTSNNRNSTYESVMTEYLSLIRSQHNILNNIINSMSTTNSQTVNIINSYADIRRRSRNITSDNSNNSTSNNSTSDNSNNYILPTRSSRLRRPRYNAPPPPPPPPPSNTSLASQPPRSQVRYYTNPRNRRTGRTTTFYTPFFPTTNNRTNIQSFINNTLWDATSNNNSPASLQTILNNTKIYKWVDIKNDNPNTERCPIDLSILTDDDIVLQINHCKHCFKYRNIFRWFAINSRCPVCRHDISTNTSINTSTDSSTDTSIDTSNNISLNVSDISMNVVDISMNVSDVSMNIIDSSNNTGLEELRSRIENLLNVDSSTNIITADITFSIDQPIN